MSTRTPAPAPAPRPDSAEPAVVGSGLLDKGDHVVTAKGEHATVVSRANGYYQLQLADKTIVHSRQSKLQTESAALQPTETKLGAEMSWCVDLSLHAIVSWRCLVMMMMMMINVYLTHVGQRWALTYGFKPSSTLARRNTHGRPKPASHPQ